MAVTVSTRATSRNRRRLLARSALVAAPVFPLTAAVLSAANPDPVLVSRRRADVALAGALTAAAVVGGTPGWYAFLIGFFAWVWCLARRVAHEPVRR